MTTPTTTATASTSSASTQNMYYEYCIPLGLKDLLLDVIENSQSSPNTPQVPVPTASQMWFSQPRPGSDPTTEVLTVNFTNAVTISELTWDMLYVGVSVQLWYQDQNNNWAQVLDTNRIPIALTLSPSSTTAWYTANYVCYQFIAKALQWRFTRVYNATVGTLPYVVGMRNGLIQRNIYVRTDGTQVIDTQQDVVGNTYTAYIQDWDASQAIDDDPNTYWRSAPQPDPAAVTWIGLDCRAADGSAQLIDTVYIDPVYTGQTLNLYYSNDDTLGTLKLSPITAFPTIDENISWAQGTGLTDISTTDPQTTSNYQFDFAWGPLISQDTWIGIQWAPNFAAGLTNAIQEISIAGGPTGGTFTLTFNNQNTSPITYDAASTSSTDIASALEALSTVGENNVTVSGGAGGPWTVMFTGALAGEAQSTMSSDATDLTGGVNVSITITTTTVGGEGDGPPINPVLFEVTPTETDTGSWWPTIYYDVGAGEFVLELTNGTSTQTYSCPCSTLFDQYVPLAIVVGWGYTPQTVFMSVVTPNGTVLGTLTNTSPNLPTLMSLDGSMGFTDFQGTFTAHVVKLENWSVGQASFQANPQVYVSPAPVQPDPSGNIPATTLDNAVYAAAWTSQENGTGGSHETAFEYKSWTPIWSNYYTEQGNLFFPQQISLKYLKLEMTNLTEEYYPVYDAGITVTYNIFPPSVTSTSSNAVIDATGMLTAGTDVTLSGIGSVNWLNPSTVVNAVNSVYGSTVTPVTVTNTPGYNSVTTLPNTTALDLASQTRQEIASPWVYKRSALSTTTLAGQTISTAASTVAVQGLTTSTASISTQVASSFNPTTTSSTSATALPTQGTDWWVFPGATLRLSASTMTGLTGSTSTVTAAKPSTETRLRFNTACVHVYTQVSAVRDATIAYYAGLREIQPYVTTYIGGEDPTVFTFDRYDQSQWVLTNINSLTTGPITTAGSLYILINGNFDTDINNWTQEQGVWTWDGTMGHWDYGSASVIADGTEKELVSTAIDVAPGANIDTSVWVTWSGLSATANSEAIQLQALFYNNGVYVSSLSQGLSYATWAASTPESGGNTWAQIVASAATETGFTVPDGVNQMSLALVVTPDASAGQINFDTVLVGTSDTVEGTAYKSFQTTSTFTRLQCTFSDSGLVLSDDMWADADPSDTNISDTALAYYTSTIPTTIPAGMWADTFADWSDTTITWGEDRPLVAINVDPTRTYDNKRVLHFTRAAGAGDAGVLVRQITNFTSNGLCQLGCVFYKPTANDNQITICLQRVSDGVYIYSETFTPIVGYWYTYVTSFFEIPESEDQEYTIQFLLTGDDVDEVYLNDLYSQIALIRYFAQLGGSDQFNHDVTALAYADTAVVSCTSPVNSFNIEVVVLDPDAYAYGMTATPLYLGG